MARRYDSAATRGEIRRLSTPTSTLYHFSSEGKLVSQTETSSRTLRFGQNTTNNTSFKKRATALCWISSLRLILKLRQHHQKERSNLELAPLPRWRLRTGQTYHLSELLLGQGDSVGGMMSRKHLGMSSRRCWVKITLLPQMLAARRRLQ